MTQRTSTRRELFGTAIAAVATAAALGAAAATNRPRRTSAAHIPVGAPATVDQRAVRLAATTTSTTTTVPIPRPSAGTLLFPMDAKPDCLVLDNFGDCRSGGSRAHLGVDIMTTRGREIYAVRPGVLSGQWLDDGLIGAGNGWTLQGDDKVVYRYMHLDGFAPGLAVGSRVTQGQLIGYAGSSGNDTPDNVHLHFEVRIDGTWVDPLPLLVLPPEAQVSSPLKACIGKV